MGQEDGNYIREDNVEVKNVGYKKKFSRLLGQ